MVTDWRILTIECGEYFNHQPSTAKLGADAIFDSLTPILATGKDQKKLKADLLGLCEEAFRLRMMMRKSREGYRCEMPTLDETSKRSLSEYKDLAEEFDVEGGKSYEGSNEIAYFLSAALTKQRGYLGEGRIVLEKGYVILKRK